MKKSSEMSINGIQSLLFLPHIFRFISQSFFIFVHFLILCLFSPERVCMFPFFIRSLLLLFCALIVRRTQIDAIHNSLSGVYY